MEKYYVHQLADLAFILYDNWSKFKLTDCLETPRIINRPCLLIIVYNKSMETQSSITEYEPYRWSTSWFCLYDFGITMSHSPPLKIFEIADVQGGECLSQAHWLGTWRWHLDDESYCKSWRGTAVTLFWLSRPSVRFLFCASISIRVRARISK